MIWSCLSFLWTPCVEMSRLQICRRVFELFCTDLRASTLHSKQPHWVSTSPQRWWCSFRLLHKLQGDDASPSKKQHLENNIQIYYDFLNLFMYLVSFSFSKRQNLSLTLQKHGIFFFSLCVCVRVSVNIIEVEASVLHVCSFTLPPVLPLIAVTLPLNFSILLYSQSKTDVVVLGGFKLFFPYI